MGSGLAARPWSTSSMWSVDRDRKSTRLNSSHTEIYTLSLHDALPIYPDIVKSGEYFVAVELDGKWTRGATVVDLKHVVGRSRSEEHTSELQSHRDLHSFPTRRSSDLSRHRKVGRVLRRRRTRWEVDSRRDRGRPQACGRSI